MEDLYNKYKDQGFTVLSIETSNRPQLAKEFTTSVGATFPIVIDDADVSGKLFNVQATPTNMMLDRDGKIYFRSVGYGPGKERAFSAQAEYLLRNASAG